MSAELLQQVAELEQELAELRRLIPPPNEKHKGVFERPVGSGKWWVRLPTGIPGKYRKLLVGTQEQATATYRFQMGMPTALPVTLNLKGVKGRSLSAAMRRFLVALTPPNPSYECHARYFERRFPDARLIDVARADVLREWKAERLQERSPSTVGHEMAFLSGVFWRAIEDGLLEHHPIGKGVNRVRYPRPAPGRLRWLTEQEEAALKAVVDQRDERAQRSGKGGLETHYWECIRFACITGLRRSEQARLEWRDEQSGQLFIAKSKNGKTRMLRLSDEAAAILAARRARGLPRPFPQSASRLTRPLKRLVQKAGLEPIGWHGFRHTAATRAVAAGISLPKVMAWLGHSSPEMTLKYSHLQPEHMADVANAMSGLVRAGASEGGAMLVLPQATLENLVRRIFAERDAMPALTGA